MVLLHTSLQALIAYLPFWTIPDGHLGPLPLHPFGLLVATGIMVGHRIASKRSEKLGLDPQRFESLVFWTVATGIVLSHVFDTIAYHPEKIAENPLELLMIHHGLSSFGGFFGAGIGFLVYGRRVGLDLWKSADAIGYGLPVGWLFGRMGCATVHDHPGRPSTHWLAVNFPDTAGRQFPFPPGPRFDLGVLELMLTPILIAVVIAVGRKTERRGAVIGALATTYAFVRFPLDFFRETDANGGDVRYLGLTPGHFASVACLLIGLYCLNYARSPRGLISTPARKTAAVAATEATTDTEAKDNDAA
ncbi:MAG: prolipoprotein diacylglyceryl transferase [Deltaproteobacteria bacterium]|nr:prolipoprotein diacylglyceryl transferase [Deltaproteobacteria bacterium]